MSQLLTFEHQSLVLRRGAVIDPASGIDELRDLFIVDGTLADAPVSGSAEFDASGLIICPGLADMHVHLREPGQTHKETIATGTAAAAAGGFTFVACMPNTVPALDTPELVRLVIERAREAGYCEVGPVAAITRGREGRELTDFAALLEAGAAAFSDDGVGVEDDRVMLAAFERAAALDALLIQHCEYKSISAGGVLHAGDVAKRMNLPGLDPRSEEAMIERDIDLCRKTGARYHVAHISTAKAVDMVRRAKRSGLPVTTEVCTHHLNLSDRACLTGNPSTKTHPPLRPANDVQACRDGLLDGTIDCIVTDHAPHSPEEKAAGFLKAPAGIIGLETALGLAVRAMIDEAGAGWPRIIKWMSAGPDLVLKRRLRRIQVGSPADLTLIDPLARWVVDASRSVSRSHNTPFDGWALRSRPVGTIRGRRLVISGEEFTGRLNSGE